MSADAPKPRVSYCTKCGDWYPVGGACSCAIVAAVAARIATDPAQRERFNSTFESIFGAKFQ
jgi:hypothetical protein